jgi:hypothetical protein
MTKPKTQDAPPPSVATNPEAHHLNDGAITPPEAVRGHIDQLLDLALQDTFPASDPVSLQFE